MPSSAKTRRTLAVVFIALLTGCASAPAEHIAFLQSTSAPIKTIALLPIIEPDAFLAANAGGQAMGFGLVGGLIQASNNTSQTKELSTLMNAENLMLSKSMAELLQAELKVNGYEVVTLAERPKVREDKTVDYSNIATTADTVLDTGFLIAGYSSTPQSTDYLPGIRFVARLVSSSDHTRRYFQIFNYGVPLTKEGIEHLPSDPRYAYGFYDALKSTTSQAGRGLQEGLKPIAVRIAEQLC
jgi:hypothetical protein